MVLVRTTLDSPVGPLRLIANDQALVAILFWNKDFASTGSSESEVPEKPDHPVLTQAATELDEYFNGGRTTFEVPLHLEGGEFEIDVWNALATIPYGETISYGEQADRINRPGAFRAVGGANGRNPLPIVLPCHRVVGSDGSLTGFGGGLAIKQWLLDHETGTQRLPF